MRLNVQFLKCVSCSPRCPIQLISGREAQPLHPLAQPFHEAKLAGNLIAKARGLDRGELAGVHDRDGSEEKGYPRMHDGM
jgi:hypothetical protein